VERAYSHWAMEFGRGTETLGFSAAIRAGRSRLAGGQHRVLSYVERGLYSEQVDRLRSHFPAAQLLFLRTEDLRERHQRTLDRVCGFIGVGRFGEYPVSVRVLPEALVAVVPDAPAPVPLPADSDLSFLQDIFRADIERTAHQTGLDLSAWTGRLPAS